MSFEKLASDFGLDPNAFDFDWFWVAVDFTRYGALFAFGMVKGITWQAERGLLPMCNSVVDPIGIQHLECTSMVATTNSMLTQMSVAGGGLLVLSFLLPVLRERYAGGEVADE